MAPLVEGDHPTRRGEPPRGVRPLAGVAREPVQQHERGPVRVLHGEAHTVVAKQMAACERRELHLDRVQHPRHVPDVPLDAAPVGSGKRREISRPPWPAGRR
ncbi:MAG: hypothetical protein M3P39_00500 [Actinomycetota bacterium]|nr:hypothetical protein [Actinomycetota bacterium]